MQFKINLWESIEVQQACHPCFLLQVPLHHQQKIPSWTPRRNDPVIILYIPSSLCICERHFPKPHALPVTSNSPRYNGHRAGDSIHASAHEQRAFSPLTPSAVSVPFPRLLACPINHYNASSSHRTLVLRALLLDDNFKPLLFDLPSSTSAAPIAQRTLVSTCERAYTEASTEKYWTRRALSLNLDVTKFHRMLTLSLASPRKWDLVIRKALRRFFICIFISGIFCSARYQPGRTAISDQRKVSASLSLFLKVKKILLYVGKVLSTGPSLIFYLLAWSTVIEHISPKERLQYDVVFIWSHILDYMIQLQNTKTAILVHHSKVRSFC